MRKRILYLPLGESEIRRWLQIVPRAQIVNSRWAAAAASHVSPLRVRLTCVSDTEPQWRHICESVRGRENPDPGRCIQPRMGLSAADGPVRGRWPRCCPNCPNVGTVWWALAIDGYTEDMLTEEQRETVRRIAGEPQSIAVLSD